MTVYQDMMCYLSGAFPDNKFDFKFKRMEIFGRRSPFLVYRFCVDDMETGMEFHSMYKDTGMFHNWSHIFDAYVKSFLEFSTKTNITYV